MTSAAFTSAPPEVPRWSDLTPFEASASGEAADSWNWSPMRDAYPPHMRT
eukprot:CAMPEP_0174843042 /NCGR_PEP_ID=MMETSP1114-20130205/10275_1 /TAXON_ID=312471 /ORGANISM="Neobodo designis, Strain CCAP 1951/1" /LENGTH=49 /DNA_ID= /DNA_START= /DNA_END= /DNA_ORIENTATION=